MLTRLIVRNFKGFTEVDIELGDSVVFVGPNNSGKTSALQALALWDLGLRRWHEKKGAKGAPKKRSGVAINRRDFVATPVPEIHLLWRDRRVRRVERENGRQKTENIRIEIEVHGVNGGVTWQCGLEFDFANSESMYCRPLGAREADSAFEVPDGALQSRVAYLPPMSGLAANEIRIDPGAVQVRLGEGRTAEVLRNLCFQLATNQFDHWRALIEHVRRLFGVALDPPEYIPERGEISMTYHEESGIRLDLSSSGRGLQQTLLLLAYAYSHQNGVLLLDEPDAHLEILRQRQIYQTLTDLARQQNFQLITASHSEVLLNEAADRDLVVAFVGQPHRIDDRGTQTRKALKSIGFEHYVQAEIQGWVLYLEGSTDLAILRSFARVLRHDAGSFLERPFVHYVENQASKAEDHFFGLREAKADLVGLVVLDRQDSPPRDRGALKVDTWQRREIENYLCFPEVLEAYAAQLARERAAGPLFENLEEDRFVQVMKRCLVDQIKPAALRNREDAWWRTVKATDDFLDPLFSQFFEELALPNLMRKTDYHVLAELVAPEMLDADVTLKLDQIVAVATEARPRL